MCEFNINKQQLENLRGQLAHERSRLEENRDNYPAMVFKAKDNIDKIIEIENIVKGILYNQSFSILLNDDEFDYSRFIDIPAAQGGVDIFKDERLGEEPGVAV